MFEPAFYLSADDKYHRIDHFGHKQETIVIPTKHGSPAVGEGAGVEAAARAPEHGGSVQGGDAEYMSNRVSHYRVMTQQGALHCAE